MKGHIRSYRIILSLVEADVSVEDLNEELNLQGRVHALVSDLQSLLQAFHHPPPITDLTTEGKKKTNCGEQPQILSFYLGKSHLSQLPFFSVWSYESDWEALLLGATHTSQEHAVEPREGAQHDLISPHAFMSHNNIVY